MPTEVHATEKQLSAFVNGRVESEEAARLEDHLATCPTCIARLEAAGRIEDGLVGELRQAMSSATSVDQSMAGIVINERYRLLEFIGTGAMGTVWRAEQFEPIVREVAVKLIKSEFATPEIIERFETERQLLARMDHPNIAKVIEAGTFRALKGPPRSFLVMELLRGQPITEYCERHGLRLRERLDLFVPVCQAIQHAHQKGIIHRDIKPSNVLVAEYDGRAMPKVIDFGVAKSMGPRINAGPNTIIGTIVGTPEYMSPEQAGYGDQDVDTRSDVYSLGALLYELIAGVPPIRRGGGSQASVVEMLRKIREDDPPKPSKVLGSDAHRLVKQVRGDLDRIVMKALEKDRSRRYETANGLAQDILRFQAGDPVHAVPATTTYQLQKFMAKHRGPVWAAALIFVALVVGAIGTAIGLVRAESEKQKAITASRLAQDEARRANQERAHAEAAAKSEREARLALSTSHGEMISHLINLVAEHRTGKPGALEKSVTGRLYAVEQWIDQARIDDPQQIFNLRSNACDAFQSLDELPRAIEQAQRALAIAQKAFGPHDATTVNSYFRLAELHRLMKNEAAATEYRNKGRSAFEAMPAPANDRERGSQYALMWYLREWINESSLAVTVAERLLTDANRRGVASEIIMKQEALSWALQRDGRTDEAVEQVRQVFRSARQQWDDVGQRGIAMNAQQLLINANRFDDDLYATISRILGPDNVHPSLLAIGGTQRMKEQKWAEAETMIRQCLAVRQRQQPNEWNTFNALSLLGGSLLGQGRLDEAEPLLVSGYEGMRERAEKIPSTARARLTEAAQRLVDLYTRLNRPADVAKWKAHIAATP